jgi:hypothetical protein
VASIRYAVQGESTEDGLIEALAARHPRIGIAGLLRRPGRRARGGRPPIEAAIDGFRWGVLDDWSQRWWPQGIEVLDGRDDVLVVSWFAQQRRGSTQGARLTVVDRRDRARPRYHHVLLVEPWRDGTAIGMRPVTIHAGGLAVVGDHLYAAATYGGLRHFELGDILRVTGRAPFGYRCVLPQSGHARVVGGAGEQRMRFSFVSVERTASGSGDHLVVGEFGPGAPGRKLGRLPATGIHSRTGEPVELIDVHEPGIARMQGAALVDGTWFATASHGERAGDLWVGSGGAWVRHPGVLLPGPEDLAASHDGARLWSLSEYPHRRWVFALDAARWRTAAGG